MSGINGWMTRRDRALVMGILNVTPDSFHDGGLYASTADAIERGIRMAEQGADIIDIGGESSRPGARSIGVQEEMDRVLPVLAGLHRRTELPLSIDTTKSQVAREAFGVGATIVNDISALRSDPEMAEAAAQAGAIVVLMHMLGTPRTMQQDPIYKNVVEEIRDFLAERIEVATHSGIDRSRILIDPGIGFGKLLEHNLEILRGLRRLAELEVPVVIGLSRKSFFGELLGTSAAERLSETIAANAVAIAYGADVIRVHDVKEGGRTADIAYRLRNHEL